MSIGRFWRTVRHLSADQWCYRLYRRGRHVLARLAPALWARRLQKLSQATPMAEPARPDLDAIADQVLVQQIAVYEAGLAAMAAGRFTFFGVTVDFGGIENVDWRRALVSGNDLLWRLNLGYMGYAVPWLASGKPTDRARVAHLVEGLEAQNPWNAPGVFRDIWNPYTASHRLINLLAGLNLHGRAGGDMAGTDFDRIRDHCQRCAVYIADNLERDLQYNHLMKNYVALAIYCAGLDSLPAGWVALPRVAMISVRQNFLADGGHAERSPMYHLLGLRDLHLLRASTIIGGADAGALDDYARRAGAALGLLSHPDGDIALFNDSWLGEALLADVTAPARPSAGRHDLIDMGYVRLEGDDGVAIFDVGSCGPDENPAHAHADFLSMELSVGGARFLVDPGTAAYAPGPARDLCRSASQHNGPHIVDAEPIEFWESFRVGRRGRAEVIADLDLDTPLRAAGRQDGYAHLGIEVRRCLGLWPGRGLLIADLWLGRAAIQRAVSRFLVPGDWLVKDGEKAAFERGDRTVTVSTLVGTAGAVQPAEWWPRFAEAEPAHALSLAAAPLGAEDMFGLAVLFHWGAPPDLDGRKILDQLKDRC